MKQGVSGTRLRDDVDTFVLPEEKRKEMLSAVQRIPIRLLDFVLKTTMALDLRDVLVLILFSINFSLVFYRKQDLEARQRWLFATIV